MTKEQRAEDDKKRARPSTAEARKQARAKAAADDTSDVLANLTRYKTSLNRTPVHLQLRARTMLPCL